MAECPICEVDFESEKSVIGHISGSTDDAHKGIGFQNARELLDHSSAEDHSSTEDYSSESYSSTENHGSESYSSESNGSVLYEQTIDQSSEQSSNSACCGSPSLTGDAGEMFRLDSGDIVQLEDGDRICANCDEVVDA